MALAYAGNAGSSLGAAMNWLPIVIGATGIVGLGALLYWQFIIAEGTYLGSRTVAWTYDRVAKRYEAIKRFNPQSESWFVASPLLRTLSDVQGPLVLDVATGTGRLPQALLRERFRGQIVGLDLSQGMLQQAQRRLRGYGDQVYLLRQDASYLPFDDGIFDAVTCLESLEFMPRPFETLSELVRVLAPGGTLMLTNRVGCEARFLPHRAIPRPRFEQLLIDHNLLEIHVRPWQANYDLALALKAGERSSWVCKPADLASFVRCPACQSRLEPHRPGQPARKGLSCRTCGRTYPLREGIVQLTEPAEPSSGH
jgi:ubiquinone/menaquinone biosynthesis C-methylase UbiE/uncharacterized protein YbaR (Trm112 family)